MAAAPGRDPRRAGPLPVALALALVAAACAPGGAGVSEARLDVREALGGSAEGYARADRARPFHFPDDHGSHPDFRNEWWYFTGNLESAGGRRWGYQLTFFRSALAPEASDRESAWATRHVYMGHFAVADIGSGRFHDHGRFARGALGLAGVRARPFRLWLEDWTVALPGAAPAPAAVPRRGDPVRITAGSGPESRRAAAATLLPLRLRAGEGEVAVDLELRLDGPLVLQGGDGVSVKGGGTDNASYYYSITRMATAGSVRVGGEEHRVTGLSWLDREWSSSALEEGQVGWDWFSLQLADGRDLMLYLLRRREVEVDPFSSGTLVESDGTSRSLSRGDFEVEVLDRWESPRGPVYPARWRLRVPDAGIDLQVEPWMADQELDLAFRYWEGAVRATGLSGGRRVEGTGYVELTGYE